MGRLIHIAVVAALLFGSSTALAATLQESAIRDGCKKYYNSKTQKEKYRECVSGASPRSQDALIQGCYDRYKATKDKLRACLGK